LRREDLFTVVLDHFITDTGQYADFILPATTQLEHWDVGDSWGQVYINMNEPAIEPRGETKPNSEIFRLLASAMGYKDECFKETDLEIAQSVFKTKSPLMKGITFNYLKKHGWARFKIPEPFLPHETGNFKTASGKCEFYTKTLESHGQALPEYKDVASDSDRFPLMLLTIKGTQNFHNSSHANVEHLIKQEGPFSIFIHEDDARSRNLHSGDMAVAENEYGSIKLHVKISDRVRPGLVMIPQGYWAMLVKGGASANTLTSDRLADHGGGGALQDCRVEVSKA
jgi:anaerobic selenocysteine-containing dehydrogenase